MAGPDPLLRLFTGRKLLRHFRQNRLRRFFSAAGKKRGFCGRLARLGTVDLVSPGGSERQNFHAGVGDEHGVLPLCR